jgi:hypothetical protein
MKTKLTLMCAVVLSMATVQAEAGYGIPGPFVFPDLGESRAAAGSDPIILASNVEFQRKVETQTTLIQHEASERRRKIEQKRDAEYLERKKEMRKKSR